MADEKFGTRQVCMTGCIQPFAFARQIQIVLEICGGVHFAGSVAVFLSFPFILSDPCTTFGWGHSAREGGSSAGAGDGASTANAGCDNWQYMLWYGVAVSVFQFGWASVQTTHLALGRELSPSTALQDQDGAGDSVLERDPDDPAESRQKVAAASTTDGSVVLYSTRYGFGIISTLIVGVAIPAIGIRFHSHFLFLYLSFFFLARA